MSGERRRKGACGSAWAVVLAASGSLLACSDSGPGPSDLSFRWDAGADVTLDGPQTTHEDATVDAPGDGPEPARDATADAIAADVATDAPPEVGEGAHDGAADASEDVDTDAPDVGPVEVADATPDVGPIDAAPEADADGATSDADASPSADGDAADAQVVTTQSLLDSMGSNCLSCAQESGCIDPTTIGTTCEVTTGLASAGPGAGTPRTALCLAALGCALTTGCPLPSDPTSDPTAVPCYCGGADCVDAAPPTGPCIPQEQAGLESISEPDIVTLLQAPNGAQLGGVAANSIATCLAFACDPQCFPPGG